MPRAGAPQWRRVKPPDLTEHVQASVNQANGVHNELGHYAELIYSGIEDRPRAELIKRNLHNAARRLGFSMSAKVERDGEGYRVRYRAIDKVHARAYMLSHYGEDSSKWPYHPKPGHPRYDPNVFKEEE